MPRDATPSDGTAPAPSPSPDTPVAPVVAPPRHLATLAAAEEAGRRGDWASVATGIQQARAEGAPAIPDWLETGLADHLAPPTLEVLEPTEGGEVEEGTVRVRGRFVSKRPGDVLRVDGSVVAAAGGTFEAGVEKMLGPQTVAFEVRDGAEVRASVARTFFVRPSRRGVPGWAHVADDQILAARAAGVPVAFENRLRMRFVYVPAGTFTMGSPETELFHEDDEPMRAVTIARPFYVAVTEATWAQSDGWNPADPDGAKGGAGAVQVETPPADRAMPRPIRRFTDAAAFAAWVGQRDAPRRYRIPREDEWEYAARATTETPFPVGDLMTSDDANVDGERPYGASPKSAYRRRLLPVGRFMHNPWGLYDVLGSLWEWTEAVTVPGGASASGAPTPVLRGGAYVSAVRDARSANRAAVRDGESDVAGVRLILDPAGVR